jgi:L-aminopeptidase/D-esterase-like protein
MMTFDFAGGIGTSSRTFCLAEGTFTVGVLVLSNFGKMRNLTIEGNVVGRGLDLLYSQEGRRMQSGGSIIVVVATDVPLLSSQLSRIAKRAALGLGRVGSHAAATSGEIIVAFSTANRTERPSRLSDKFIRLKCISDAHINDAYEAVIEATEEAVLNAVFCSNDMSGRKNRSVPAISYERVMEEYNQGRSVHESH